MNDSQLKSLETIIRFVDDLYNKVSKMATRWEEKDEDVFDALEKLCHSVDIAALRLNEIRDREVEKV